MTKAAPKLTRQQIKEGLDTLPIETLLSSGRGKKPALTTKQREFARGIALGKTKAQAYRDAYEGRTETREGKDLSPASLVSNPYNLAKDKRIQAEVEAYTLAIEAEKHRTPAQLKALLVQQLVQHSLDPEFPPAQRVQCLKLLGSLFEVGAFVERKEVTTVSRSGDIRQRILETLKDVTDVTTIDSGLDLLEEIKAGQPGQPGHEQYSEPQASEYESNTEHGEGARKHGEIPASSHADVIPAQETDPLETSQPDPTTGAPAHSGPADGGVHTHSISLTRSLEKSEDPPHADLERK